MIKLLVVIEIVPSKDIFCFSSIASVFNKHFLIAAKTSISKNNLKKHQLDLPHTTKHTRGKNLEKSNSRTHTHKIYTHLPTHTHTIKFLP